MPIGSSRAVTISKPISRRLDRTGIQTLMKTSITLVMVLMLVWLLVQQSM